MSTQFTDLVATFRQHAADRPDAPALAWFDDRPEVVEHYTAAEYLTRCEGLAGALLARGCEPGEPVLLIHPPGLAFFDAFLACLIAGLVPVPAYPPDPLGRGPRLDFITRICPRIGIRFGLTTARYNHGRRLGNVRHVLRRGGGWPDVKWIATDRLAPGKPPPPRHPGPDALAFMQFTSGSTADPRGVAISHGNLMHQLRVNAAQGGMTRDSRGVVWLPQYHDFGLVNAYLCSLAAGSPMWMCSPLDFLKNPAIWPEMMHRVGGTHSASPDFGFTYTARKTTAEQRRGWDLSSVTCIASGGEAIRPETVERFAEAFAPCGLAREALYGGYGQAEHVVGMTGGVVKIRHFDRGALQRGEALRPVFPGDPRGRPLASSGRAFAGVELRMVDPEAGVALPDGRVGEIWVHSPSVALGYVGEPERTRAVFENRLPGEGARRWLRTGDLGALIEGDLYVTGRLRELIIVRGRNVYPADVESAIRALGHPAVRPGGIAAVGFELDGEEQLAVLVELGEADGWRGRLPELAEIIRAAVGGEQLHLGRLLLVERGTLPKTTSGKLRRADCARWVAEGTLAGDRRLLHTTNWSSPAPAPEADEQLTAAVRQLSTAPPSARRDAARAAALAWMAALPDGPIDSARLPTDETGLSALGLDSLRLAGLIEAVERATGHRIDRGALFEMTTFGRLIDWITEASAAPPAAPEPPPAPWTGPAPATPFQRHIRRDHGDAPGAVMLFEISGSVTAAHVRRATAALLDRHDLLRARFVEAGDRLEMVPDPDCAPTVIEVAPGPRDGQMQRIDTALRAPFLVDAPPLFRPVFAPSEGDGPALLGLAVHHLIYDGFSIHALVDEWLTALGQVADGASPSDTPGQSFLSHARGTADPRIDPADVAWWQAALADAPWPMPVPDDVSPPTRWMELAGRFVVPDATAEALRALARRCETTLNAVLARAWAEAMGAALGVATVTCAHPVSTRGARTRALCGPLVEDVLLPLPATPTADADAAVRQTGAVIRDALRHQAVPFEVMAQALDPSNDVALRGCPVFFAFYEWDRLCPQPAMKTLRRGHPWRASSLMIRACPIPPATGPRPFDYFAMAESEGGRLTCSLRVNRGRVGAAFGAGIVDGWQRALTALAAGEAVGS